MVLLPGLALLIPLVVWGQTEQSLPSLQWQACQDEPLASFGYECATLIRPLRRREPDGPKVELAVFRLSATGTAKERIGTVFFNPGGPGQPGHGSAYKGMLLPDEIRRAFDFVIWDPRGLASPGLHCRIVKCPCPADQRLGPWTGSRFCRSVS